MDRSIVRDLFLGSFDRISILLQAFTEGSDFFRLGEALPCGGCSRGGSVGSGSMYC